MKDLMIELDDAPGTLAAMGEALGDAGISVEGGGAFVVDGRGIAHFLFEDAAPARTVLERAGIRVLAEDDVLVQKLNQSEAGQLGKLCRSMAENGVNIRTLYSDHRNQLILIVDNPDQGRKVSEAWQRENGRHGP